MFRKETLSTEISSEEAQLEFELRSVDNERNRWGDDPYGEPCVLKAIVRPISESDWIFKTQFGGQTQYMHCRYGVIEGETRFLPSWHNLWNGMFATPEQAIQAATNETPDVTGVVPKTPPIIRYSGDKVVIQRPRDQLQESDVTRHGGLVKQIEGREWVECELPGFNRDDE